ncbi:MAG: thioredoxin domain-containing protein [Planctomycetota bacterium]
MTTSTNTNRLAHEASPYLLQHANNPVDWYPWGQEAFDKAKIEDKPVFLSIGYSTCHWCHVMAHESFENQTVADYLNAHFVSIKVDREERPDIDAIYMEFVQKTTGGGGWPMTVFLTPEAKPFYGGTYFPPADAYGRPGFMTLLSSIVDAWGNKREDILNSADQILTLLQEKAQTSQKLDAGQGAMDVAYHTIGQIYDSTYGGFGQAPKFPQPGILSFLMVYAHRTHDKHSLKMVETTLEKMAYGGIYDHLGGGFHRYSVDPQWLVPHFEKMLYDQALITRAYIQAYQITSKALYMQTAKDVFDYVLRDLTDAGGGFYSAEDADSEGHEGTFYVWTAQEIESLLSDDEAKLIQAYYQVSENGNFERGKSILNVKGSLEEAGYESGIESKRAMKLLPSAKRKLFVARNLRSRPHRDEKIIAGWNGLMISSLAYGGAVFNEPKYIQAARKSAAFVLDQLYSEKRLKRYYAKGKGRGRGVLEDYAYLIRGLLDLYQADFDPRWLVEATQLGDQMIELFYDKDQGGFYMTDSDADDLIVRTKPDYDGATPSGNSIAVVELIRLSELTGDKKWLAPAEKTLAFYQDQLKSRGTSLTDMLIGLDAWMGPRSEVVIAGRVGQAETQQALSMMLKRFLPRTVVLVRDDKRDATLLEDVSETAKSKVMVDGHVTFYLCRDFVCQRPITETNEFEKAIKKLN